MAADDGTAGCRSVVASGVGMGCCVDAACCAGLETGCCAGSEAGCCSGVGLGATCCFGGVDWLVNCGFFKGAPQYLQNKSVSLFSFPQLVQNMTLPSSQ